MKKEQTTKLTAEEIKRIAECYRDNPLMSLAGILAMLTMAASDLLQVSDSVLKKDRKEIDAAMKKARRGLRDVKSSIELAKKAGFL